MNFDTSLLFCYLEEDNIQRAYFRVRPLLTTEGDVREEAGKLWPNEGCLRIVPDRNEQHTFKIRMRTLGSYCVVDLRGQPADAGKIRTNKNFRPDRGEVNQYILYSDTVHALPENSFYQIVDGKAADYADAAARAITPLFYIREDDTLYGPLNAKAPVQPDTAQEAAGILCELPCPDGVTRLMLCMDNAPAPEPVVRPEVRPAAPAPVQQPVAVQQPAPVPQPVAAPAPVMPDVPAAPAEPVAATVDAAALPIGEKLVILDQQQSHEDTLRKLDKPVSSGANLLRQQPAAAQAPAAPAEPLTGTPLVRTPLQLSQPQAKNRTQEVVSTQWSVGKYEPPAQSFPSSVRMRDVENPVEAACASLRTAWNATANRDQLTDFILSLDGIRAALERKLCPGSNETVMQHVLRGRLQDLEAERLTALCELDRAQRDVDAYKQELLNGMAARVRRETGELESARDAARTQLDSMKTELNALALQRDALMSRVSELQSATLPEAAAALCAQMQMLVPVNGTPLRMRPAAGAAADAETIIARVMDACQASGVAIDRNTAITLLALLALSPRIGLACPTPGPLSTLVRNIVCMLGWQHGFAQQTAAEQRPLCGERPVDATPALLMTSLPNYAPIAGVTKLLMNRSSVGLVRNAAYDVNAWPVLTLPSLPFLPEMDEQTVQPVAASSVSAMFEKRFATDAEIDQVLLPVLNAAAPLSGVARKRMYAFVAVCAGLLEGGLPVAVDWAIAMWICPGVERGTRQHAAVKALLDEYPLSLSKLSAN